jgi:hypothetical protein
MRSLSDTEDGTQFRRFYASVSQCDRPAPDYGKRGSPCTEPAFALAAKTTN